MRIRGTELKVVKGDITDLKAEAIVNTANYKLTMSAGVALAIKRKGGGLIEEEALKKAPIEAGKAVSTGAGSLKAKYVVHAATMDENSRTDEVKIRSSCKNSLKLAEELKLKSIAFPALGCGEGGFPYSAAAKIMAQEVFKHLRENKSNLEEVIFCLYEQEAYQAFKKNVFHYLEYMMNKLQEGPFTTVDAIIEVPGGIVLIERSNPPFGWALPGGFVDYGESLEDAVRREVKEETGLDLEDVRQFHTYSEPSRDPRFHTIGTVFIAKAKGQPQAGDDAKGARVVTINKINKLEFAFDHKQILKDYLNHIKGFGR